MAFQEEMFHKMTDLIKIQGDEQLREVQSKVATVNALILTGSQTPPPYNSIPIRNSMPSSSHVSPFNLPPIPPFNLPPPRPPLTSNHRSPDSTPWGEGSSDDEFNIAHRDHRRTFWQPQHASRLKVDTLVLYGLTNNEAFNDWVADVEDYFAYVPIDENTTAQLVAL